MGIIPETIWGTLDPVWRDCLELAWDAARAGSAPVGAAIVDPSGTVAARGRNRMGERDAPPAGLAGTPMAHAEINAFLALPRGMSLADYTLFTTLEPCTMCASVIASMGVGRVRFLGADAVDPGARLLRGRDAPVWWPVVHVDGPRGDPLGAIAEALAAEFFWRRGPGGIVARTYRAQRPAIARLIERMIARDLTRHAVLTNASFQDMLPVFWDLASAEIPSAGERHAEGENNDRVQ